MSEDLIGGLLFISVLLGAGAFLLLLGLHSWQIDKEIAEFERERDEFYANWKKRNECKHNEH